MAGEKSGSGVTVIVLARNASATIGRTLRSLSGQTVPPAQVVVVDDASTDSTAAIVGQWAGTGHGITVTLISHDRQRGTADGTAGALTKATGTYVMRCDADDTLPPDAIDRMLAAAARDGADVVAGPMNYICGNKVRVHLPGRDFGNLNEAPVNTVTFSLCNKLIRRSLLVDNKIAPFEGADCWEDLGMVARVMALCPRVALVDEPVYNYYEHRGVRSLSRSDAGRLLRDHITVAARLDRWFAARGLSDEYGPWLDRVKLCAKVKLLRGRDKDVARWLATFPEINGRILAVSHVGLAYRLMFAAVAVMPARLTQLVADATRIFY